MKCPKCDYLGFDTGDRCRNCGYDFSLVPTAADPDLRLDAPDADAKPSAFWLDQLDQALGTPVAATPSRGSHEGATATPSQARRAEPALPLFRPGADDDDRPLISLPAAPRAPLAVRKTPENPRLRHVPKAAARSASPDEPVLQFVDEAAPDPELRLREDTVTPVAVKRPAAALDRNYAGVSGASRRIAAAAVDHAILFAIDAAVVYLTLQIAALPVEEWRILPLAPLIAFLVLVKFAYFCAFTAVGGQTIGKMALSIRVVTDENAAVEPACAIRRTLAGTASLVFGLGFVPALFGRDHLALHDRVAHTRVVALRPI